METCLMSTKDYHLHIFYPFFFFFFVVWQFLKTFGRFLEEPFFFFFFLATLLSSSFTEEENLYAQRMSPIKISVLSTEKWTFCDSFLFESCSNTFKLSIFHWTQVSLLSFFFLFFFCLTKFWQTLSEIINILENKIRYKCYKFLISHKIINDTKIYTIHR